MFPPRLHYDPVVFAPSEGAPESFADLTVVDESDDAKYAKVAALAQRARAAHQFTDTSTFALKCLVCGKGLKGQQDAQDHASATGHANFAQTGN